ncbi:hypothetical protein DL765_006222 [Monosporascus sp. GIB2]|nr:hypothetical protein DL765_006222 [Monosporascus sp. GIB2]
MPQDMPPVGGYGPVQYKLDYSFGRAYGEPEPGKQTLTSTNEGIGDQQSQERNKSKSMDADRHRIEQAHRNLPASGFRPGTWLLGMGVVMAYGFYKLGQGIREQNELAREKMWSRIHLIPMLQAEEDRDLVRRHLADQAREKELLGENFKVYNSDRYVRPTYAATPANTTK